MTIKINSIYNGTCEGCDQEFYIICPINCCQKCLAMKLKPKFWERAKEFSIYALLVMPPACFIGLYFGLTTEVLWCLSGLLGANIGAITNFIKRKI